MDIDFDSNLINIDKPIGPTSHQTTTYVKEILNLKKAGHSGTLDPKVSGVLPVAFNRGTRILEILLAFPKEYIGVMRIHEDISINLIREKIKKKFLGKIKQTPPVKSAVKRRERIREIYEFKLLKKEKQDIIFRVKVQSGTYIRKLIHDLGEELKVGAHMAELRRTYVGFIKEKDSHTLYELADAMKKAKKGNTKKLKSMLIPLEKCVFNLNKAKIKKSSIDKVKFGQVLTNSDILSMTKKDSSKIYALFSQNSFLALSNNISSGKKKILKPYKVFI